MSGADGFPWPHFFWIFFLKFSWFINNDLEPGDDIVGNSWLGHSLHREEDMRDKKLNIQDLEAKDMNRPIDSNRYDISGIWLTTIYDSLINDS